MQTRATMLASFLVVVNMIGSATAQQPNSPPTQVTSVPRPPLPFAAQMKKTVVFIQTDCRHVLTVEEAANPAFPKGTLDSHSGTGFLVSLADARLPELSFGYLITNRHVAEPGIENGQPCEVVSYTLRLNLRQKTEAGFSQVMPLGASPGWKFPDDPSVDLAALPIAADLNIFDIMAIPTTEMANQSMMAARNVIEGDSVIFSGLFVQYMGQTRVEPIVRTGTLAMLPDEPILTTLNKRGRVYLAEAHVFGGNSGSPMFINLGGMRGGGISSVDYKLLGVVSGEFFETQSMELKAAASFKGNVYANSGISMVVPAEEVIGLLNCREFQSQRDAVIASKSKH